MPRDMLKYAGTTFIKAGDVKDAPMRVRIVDVEDGKFDKPDLVFDDGSKLSANTTNVRTLVRAYGRTDADWIGREIELRLGELEYDGKLNETVVIKPITPPVGKKPPEMDEEIPF